MQLRTVLAGVAALLVAGCAVVVVRVPSTARTEACPERWGRTEAGDRPGVLPRLREALRDRQDAPARRRRPDR
jgi:hypothetical protein